MPKRKQTGKPDEEFPPIHVLVCGDRNWDDDYIVTILMVGFKYWHGLNVHIWHGATPGADSMAHQATIDVPGVIVHPFVADWEHEGRAAGPKRNERMLRAMLSEASRSRSSVTMGVALKDDIQSKSGTRDMVKRLLKADVPVYVISRPLLSEL
jgi:hypothetical protein